MTITLPDDMRAEVEAKARAAGLPMDAYVRDVILRALTKDECGSDRPSDEPPSRLTPRNRAELEAMLDDGMASGDVVQADEAFWEDQRRLLLSYMAAKTGVRS
jgi:hypothetical protein